MVSVGSRRILKYEAGGFSRFEPVAVTILWTNTLYGVFAATWPRIHARNAAAPSGPRYLRLTCSLSAHLFVQCSTKSSLPMSRSITASRLARRIALIVEESPHLVGRWRQPRQVEVDAAEEFGVARQARRQDLHPLPFGGDQFVDLPQVSGCLPDEAAAVAHHGERGGRVGAFVTGQHRGLAAADRGETPCLSAVATSVLPLSMKASRVTSRVVASA